MSDKRQWLNVQKNMHFAADALSLVAIIFYLIKAE